MIGIVLLWFLNMGISVFNALSVGAVWSEVKQLGGFPRFVNWCGAIMSACGFIWCYLILEGLVFYKLGKLTEVQLNGLFSLGYLVIIGPVIGSGLGITVFSWTEFSRRRSIKNAAVAGYNTFAQLHNTYRAIQGIPEASRGVSDLFGGRSRKSSSSSSGSSDGKGAGGLVVLILLLAALILGIFTTWAIVRWADRKYVLNIGDEFNRADRRFRPE